LIYDKTITVNAGDGYIQPLLL